MRLSRAIVVRPGEGHHVGNVEFLARTANTPRFNFAIVTIKAHGDGPEMHTHVAEDDAFYILDGELVFTVDGEEIVAGAGTFVLALPMCTYVHEPRRYDRAIRQRARSCGLRSQARRGDRGWRTVESSATMRGLSCLR